MKKIIAILIFSVVSLGTLSAQGDSPSVNGKKKSYLANEWFDNLYIGAGGGISTRFTAGKQSDIVKNYINPSAEIYLMKWFTPTVGIRLGYLGFNAREGLNGYVPFNHSPFPYKPYGSDHYSWNDGSSPGILYYGSMYLHADLAWNLMNFIKGYERTRFYNISLYFTGGYLHLYNNVADNWTVNKGQDLGKGLFSKAYDREFALGGGVLNTFKITDRLFATVDLRYTNHASRYRTISGIRTHYPALNVGLMYNLYRTDWITNQNETQKASGSASTDDVKEAKMAANSQPATAGESIQIDNLSYDDLKALADKADIIVYYYIGQSELNFAENHHLQDYAREALKKDPDYKFTIIGSADKGKGSLQENIQLSSKRAEFVKNMLMTEFGVSEKNIKTTSVVTDKHAEGALDRCAIIVRQ